MAAFNPKTIEKLVKKFAQPKKQTTCIISIKMIRNMFLWRIYRSWLKDFGENLQNVGVFVDMVESAIEYSRADV